MSLRRILPRVVLCALGVTTFASAHADTFNFSGNFAADNSSYELIVNTPTSQAFTFSTTSFAAGGFVPVLSLFDSTGAIVGNGGSGTSDAVLSETLAAGSYELFLTEFPNVAVGNLSEGFLTQDDPSATGTACNMPGGMFLNSGVAPCTQLGSNYALTVDSASAATVMPVASTPEPSSLLLMLAPAAGMLWTRRRQNA